MSDEEYDEATDPFSAVNAPAVGLIVQMRIYDVLMAILNETNPDMASKIHEAHSQGKIIGSWPYLDM